MSFEFSLIEFIIIIILYASIIIFSPLKKNLLFFLCILGLWFVHTYAKIYIYGYGDSHLYYEEGYKRAFDDDFLSIIKRSLLLSSNVEEVDSSINIIVAFTALFIGLGFKSFWSVSLIYTLIPSILFGILIKNHKLPNIVFGGLLFPFFWIAAISKESLCSIWIISIVLFSKSKIKHIIIVYFLIQLALIKSYLSLSFVLGFCLYYMYNTIFKEKKILTICFIIILLNIIKLFPVFNEFIALQELYEESYANFESGNSYINTKLNFNSTNITIYTIFSIVKSFLGPFIWDIRSVFLYIFILEPFLFYIMIRKNKFEVNNVYFFISFFMFFFVGAFTHNWGSLMRYRCFPYLLLYINSVIKLNK